MELLADETAVSQYEELLQQYDVLVNNAEVSVAVISDKIPADSVEQLTDILHDNQVCPRLLFTYCFTFAFALS